MSFLDRLKALLAQIPKDKIKHAAAGAAASLFGCLVFSTAWAGVILAALAGAGKEWYDRKHGGTSEFADTAATVIGGMAVAAIYGMLS